MAQPGLIAGGAGAGRRPERLKNNLVGTRGRALADVGRCRARIRLPSIQNRIAGGVGDQDFASRIDRRANDELMPLESGVIPHLGSGRIAAHSAPPCERHRGPIKRSPCRPHRRQDSCNAWGVVASCCFGLVHHAAFARDTLLGTRCGVGVNGPRRRLVLVTEHERRDERRTTAAAGHCFGNTGHFAPDRNGNQFCIGTGSCGRKSAKQCGYGSLRWHERSTWFANDAGVYSWHPERLHSFSSALPGCRRLFACTRQRKSTTSATDGTGNLIICF